MLSMMPSMTTTGRARRLILFLLLQWGEHADPKIRVSGTVVLSQTCNLQGGADNVQM